MPIITISRGSYCKGKEVAEKVATKIRLYVHCKRCRYRGIKRI